MSEAHATLNEAEFDLLITGGRILEGDVIELIASQRGRVSRVLVIAGHIEPQLAENLRTYAVNGVFDSSRDNPDNLERAVRATLASRHYWSPCIHGSESSKTTIAVSLRSLSPTERLVLATIGDGTDNDAASSLLGMAVSSIQSVRRSLHLKLGVRHKGDLMCKAVELGFVRFDGGAPTRIGFGNLLTGYYRESKRPVPLSPALAARYPEAAQAAALRRPCDKFRSRSPEKNAVAA